MSGTLQNVQMLFLEIRFIPGQKRLVEIMRNEKTNLMVQSDSTRSERILQEKHLKIFERSTHTWTP